MLIFLTGFMGAGKTTAGKKLASALEYKFIDLDLMIENETGKTISELFSLGQDKFREIESLVLKQTQNFQNTVISTGGGTPCFHGNMKWMNQQGITVYIKLTVGSLFHRLLPVKSGRPLIADKSDVELMEFIVETLKDREKYYRLAKYTVKGENLDVKAMLEELRRGEPQLR